MYEMKLFAVAIIPAILMVLLYITASAYFGRTLFESLFDSTAKRDVGVLLMFTSMVIPVIISGIAYWIGFPSTFSIPEWGLGTVMYVLFGVFTSWGLIGLVCGSDIPKMYSARSKHFIQVSVHNIDFTKYEVGQYLIRTATEYEGTPDQNYHLRLYRVTNEGDFTGVYKVLERLLVVYDKKPFTVESIKDHLQTYFRSINYYTTNSETMTVIKPADKLPDVIILE